jgi:hypothetical protein
LAGKKGLWAAVLFLLLASVRIEAQGPQYDELHQAVGAFTWVGAPPPPIFCTTVYGVCVLNMPYIGAIKTNLYGAWLRLTGSRFTLASWRLFGILLIATGIVLFCVLAGPALPPWAMAVFLALLLTDGAVLLAGRRESAWHSEGRSGLNAALTALVLPFRPQLPRFAGSAPVACSQIPILMPLSLAPGPPEPLIPDSGHTSPLRSTWNRCLQALTYGSAGGKLPGGKGEARSPARSLAAAVRKAATNKE